jgi:hypothetical protein
MKFTKRSYIKVWQNCPEDEREDTTITLYDYEDANELNNCGQRFKFIDQPVYKHQSNHADILRTLKLKAETQPTFDLAELNQ